MGEMQAKLLREKLESGVEVEELQDKEWVSGGVIQSLNPLREDGPVSIPASPAAAAAAVHASGGGRSAGRRSSAAAPEAAPQLMVHIVSYSSTLTTKLVQHSSNQTFFLKCCESQSWSVISFFMLFHSTCIWYKHILFLFPLWLCRCRSKMSFISPWTRHLACEPTSMFRLKPQICSMPHFLKYNSEDGIPFWIVSSLSYELSLV
jgi:hypothetical protein